MNYSNYLTKFAEYITMRIKAECNLAHEGVEMHNHPPVRKLVEGCDYCKKYGNCLMLCQTVSSTH